ncbi:hypothetical protein NA57DRAFT_51232 [Rhizodiscina lignyota]|uniref:G-patch domain-containing protein n=1 Tax=Rhizodiscina lignyota TaxID=1504668 RepID=A0A9P4IMS6_9PEZI|nr:hypothetical protein NA57DRAFT_51232 [Rhizodiscina lignyota]
MSYRSSSDRDGRDREDVHRSSDRAPRNSSDSYRPSSPPRHRTPPHGVHLADLLRNVAEDRTGPLGGAKATLETTTAAETTTETMTVETALVIEIEIERVITHHVTETSLKASHLLSQSQSRAPILDWTAYLERYLKMRFVTTHAGQFARDKSTCLWAHEFQDLSLHMGLGSQIKEQMKHCKEYDAIKDICVGTFDKFGRPKVVGFIRFEDTESAKSFLERESPSIYLYTAHGPRGDDGGKVGISYSDKRDEHYRYICAVPAVHGSTSSVDPASLSNVPGEFYNDGSKDVAADSDPPTKFLLVRKIGDATEEKLAEFMTQLYKDAPSTSTPSATNLGAPEGSIRRVLIARDKITRFSNGYGFVEFRSAQDAQAALAKFDQIKPLVMPSRSHRHLEHDVKLNHINLGVLRPWTVSPFKEFSIADSADPSKRYEYWDLKAYLSELVVSAAPATPLPKEAQETKGTKRKAATQKTSEKKKALLPAHLDLWHNRHAELHGGRSKEQKAPAQETSQEEAVEPHQAPTPAQSYADPNKHCCYLCSRQFKSAEEVEKHESQSELHKKNLKSEELKAKALEKLKKAGVAEDTLGYRDRAKERRQFHKQPKKPSATPSSASKPNPAEQPVEAAGGVSKGASLLGKMGWSAGEGLGAAGTGITVPVSADLYAAGVGLGAAGGRLGDASEAAEKDTRGGYKEYLEDVKDKAKQRYENM